MKNDLQTSFRPAGLEVPYVEKLVLDQDYLFSTNPQISADLRKFANVRNWSRMLEIPADLCLC